jgi:hypothetical protein
METRNAPAYEEDFVAWLEDQAQRARRRETDGLDLENIAEESKAWRAATGGNSQPPDRPAYPVAEIYGSAKKALFRLDGNDWRAATSDCDRHRRQSKSAIASCLDIGPVLRRRAVRSCS